MREYLEIQPGKVLRELPPQKVSALAKAWLDIFAKDRQGANTKAFLWHTFSFKRYPCVSGAEALIQYAQQTANEYIVLSNDRVAGYVTDERPTECDLPDWYVFPANFAWTMAFTHEDGWLGPYFARHERYTDLNNENVAKSVAKIRKARDAEAAKLKGWR